MRVLAVQIDEPLAEGLQLRERGRAAVDPRPALALRVEHAAQQYVAVVRGDALLGEPGGDARRVRDVELGGELGALRARPELAELEAVAEQERQRVEQDRLARARLAGQHGKAGGELDVERFDDDEISDGQETQHGAGQRRRAGGSEERRMRAGRSCVQGCARMRSGVSLQWSFSRSMAK